MNNNCLASSACNSNINRLSTKTARVLEKVVILAVRGLPSRAAVDRYLQALNWFVVIDNLHREPILRGAALVMEDKGAGYATSNKLVRGVDDAIRATNCCEGVGEKVEMAFSAFGALVHDLRGISALYSFARL